LEQHELSPPSRAALWKVSKNRGTGVESGRASISRGQVRILGHLPPRLTFLPACSSTRWNLPDMAARSPSALGAGRLLRPVGTEGPHFRVEVAADGRVTRRRNRSADSQYDHGQARPPAFLIWRMLRAAFPPPDLPPLWRSCAPGQRGCFPGQSRLETSRRPFHDAAALKRRADHDLIFHPRGTDCSGQATEARHLAAYNRSRR